MLIGYVKLKKVLNHVVIRLFISKELQQTFINMNKMLYDDMIYMEQYKTKKKIVKKKRNKKMLKTIKSKLEEEE